MAGARHSHASTWVAGLLVALSTVACATHQQVPAGYADVRGYISNQWDVLTRSPTTCEVIEDSKVPEPWVLYLPKDLPEPASLQQLRQNCPKVQIQRLPWDITGPGQADVPTIAHHGLLFLEHPYVVPGGRFNEMYGWDSYFIIRGLLRDGREELARGMVRNFFFELEHYGAVLNANRTYYLSRSQPPFLSSMVLAVHPTLEEAEQPEWLAEAYPSLVRDYEMWTRGEHLAGDTGLSRFYDYGEGAVPEIAVDHNPYYFTVLGYFLRQREAGQSYLCTVLPERPGPPLPACERNAGTAHCTATECLALRADYYKGDRSMRESGFDVAFRFGPYSGGTHHFAPVDLNSLLFKTEKDLERISTLLGRAEEARAWGERAVRRQELMNRYLWDAQRGMYFDFDFVAGQRSSYEYATTFYPLWTGLASEEQARSLVGKLSHFEQPGGLTMSRQESGAQWDYPYGWAPIQLLTIEGLRRYGYGPDADRLSRKFLDMVAENYRRERTIREKYDVVTRSSEVKPEAGDYQENVVGFGWTNGVFLELLHGIQQEEELPRRSGRRPQPHGRELRP